MFGRREVVVVDRATGRRYTPANTAQLLHDAGLDPLGSIVEHYLGFVKFAEYQKKHSISGRLFPDLRPDKYGNYARYALKRFSNIFLPSEITLQQRQAFYSFRHNFRDALRRINAPPDTLQALGGWSQGKLTSDNYGDKSDPDYQIKFMEQVAFPELDLSHLH